jgi:hypothetical protein
MRLRNKLLACGAVFTASMATTAYGTSRQVECFDDVANEYGVDSVDDLPEKILDDSGCVSILNTLGFLGASGSVVAGVGFIIIDRRRPQEITSERERLPLTKPAQCLGTSCIYFVGKECESRMELLEATGAGKNTSVPPFKEDASYALYGQVCTGGVDEEIVRFAPESPNGLASTEELIGRMGRLEGQKIVLTPRL